MVKIMENPIKTDDLGVPLFLETPIWGRWTHFDDHIFQMGLNHQLDILLVKSAWIAGLLMAFVSHTSSNVN